MLWPISAAISSTERSPWARRSTISARRPLANALATSAKPSNSASLAARSPIACHRHHADPTCQVFKRLLDNRANRRKHGPMTGPAARPPIAFVDDGLGNSSYLVDVGDRRCLVVDPARHPAGYLA